jgi:hypothetical protein
MARPWFPRHGLRHDDGIAEDHGNVRVPARIAAGALSLGACVVPLCGGGSSQHSAAPIPIYIREVGLGFGYRYTLAMIKKADETDDIKQLIRELDKLAGSQGNLSNVSAWRLDIEEPEEKPRWTIAMRAMLSTASAAAGVTIGRNPRNVRLPTSS